MKIYLAGYYNGKASVYGISADEYPWMLESYYYIKQQRHVDLIRRDAPRKIFLDSGAYSAYSKNVTIDLDTYADYINKYEDIIDQAANLDDLTGDKDEAAKNSAANMRLLEKVVPKNIPIIPVYHCRENVKWLKALLDRYNHIALGGMVPETNKFLRIWLDEIWDRYLTNADGTPRVKVHGFGLTTVDIMLRYPWYSVDSTRWVLAGRFGTILTEGHDGSTKIVDVSDQSPRRRVWDRHYDTLPEEQRRAVDRLVESRGFSIHELRTIYWKRDLWNVQFFRELSEKPAAPFKLKRSTLF